MIWQERALKCVEYAEEQLWGLAIACKRVRKWLDDRRLTRKTIQDARLGWLPEDKWERRKEWGLPEKIEGGKRKKLWLPSGLIIPCFYEEEIVRLRVRRPDSKNGPKYYLVPGGDTGAMRWKAKSGIYVIVESELDGMLLWQEASDLLGVVAMGNAQTRPDRKTHDALRRAPLVLLALDSDQAGAVRTWRWWLRYYKQAKWWPIPLRYGKDPSEAFRAGLDLRAWIKAALTDPTTKPKEEVEEHDVTIEDLFAEGDDPFDKDARFEDLLDEDQQTAGDDYDVSDLLNDTWPKAENVEKCSEVDIESLVSDDPLNKLMSG
jgi:hypothetical protein